MRGLLSFEAQALDTQYVNARRQHVLYAIWEQILLKFKHQKFHHPLVS